MDDVTRAHLFSNNHMEALKKDKICGCFYCLKIFPPSEIEEWIIADNDCDRYGTAICPYCGIDYVIGESSGYPITKEFLARMKKRWF
ncbi:MAG: cytoplasmic protein [Ruminococcus sp.]|nr:cytoplasmic protein [Ruminococcus sp.]